VSARAEVRKFRYELWTRSGEPKFASDLPASVAVKGPCYEVETDTQGRTTRVAVIRDGTKISETLYRFPGNAKLPNASDNFVTGEQTGVTRIQRNETGGRAREEYFTTGGTLTGYAVFTYSTDGVEQAYYSAEGKATGRYVYYYSSKDVIARSRQYLENAYYEAELDETTGLPKSRKKFVDGKLELSTVYAYDSYGDKTREDAYHPDGKWFAAIEFAQGLVVRKNYRFDTETRQSQITFDEKRRAKEAKWYVNDKLVCTFTYDRLPDGTLKRSLALGPGGELWAEYPNVFVNEVQQNGQALNRTDGIIYKKGNWW